MLSQFRPNVLVIEDELLQRRMLANTLKEEGARVVLSESAEDAQVVLQAIQVSIVLVDIQLEGRNVIEFIRWARSQPAYADTPIIVVTSGGDSALQVAFEAGAHGVIRKPTPPRELLIRVSAALRMARLIEQRKEKERELQVSLVVDCLEQKVSCVQAGQPSAFVLKDCALSLWDRGGRTVGMLPDTTWDTRVEPTTVGTRVLMYTDGLPDLAGPNGEMYSELRLEQTVTSRCHESFSDFREGVEKDLRNWSSSVPPSGRCLFLAV